MDEFAIIAVLTTLYGLLGFADFGIGNGLVSRTALRFEAEDYPAVRKEIASAGALLIAVLVGGSLVLGLALLAGATSPIDSILGQHESPGTIAAVFELALLAAPLGIAQRVYWAVGQLWVVNVALAVGSLMSLGFVVIATSTQAPLWLLAAASLAGPLTAGTLSTALLLRNHPEFRPRPSSVDWHTARGLLGSGLLFFVITIAGIVGYQIDIVVVSHYLTPDRVAAYALALRVFSVGPTIAALILTPLWPMYARALAAGDSAWLWRTFRRTCVWGTILNAAWAIAILAAGDLPWKLLSAGKIEVPLSLTLAFAAWTILNGLNGSVATLLNGAGLLRLQAVLASLMACVNLLVSLALVMSVGVAGPVLGSIIAQVLVFLLPAGFYLRKWSRPMSTGAEGAM